ncbi:hypothetical protein KP509_1Z171500 [Ceratopteris richardii]|nr:hypothetical protein KP509_1Z171500 [Ceratopteris richardii]
MGNPLLFHLVHLQSKKYHERGEIHVALNPYSQQGKRAIQGRLKWVSANTNGVRILMACVFHHIFQRASSLIAFPRFKEQPIATSRRACCQVLIWLRCMIFCNFFHS